MKPHRKHSQAPETVALKSSAKIPDLHTELHVATLIEILHRLL